jgi:plastocyanin
MTMCACSDHTGPDVEDAPPTATANVDVQDNQFAASSVRVLQGGTVHWTWRGGNVHNVTFTGGPASETRSSGTFERTFETPGTFSYMCTVHGPSMSGRVTVVAAGQ